MLVGLSAEIALRSRTQVVWNLFANGVPVRIDDAESFQAFKRGLRVFRGPAVYFRPPVFPVQGGQVDFGMLHHVDNSTLRQRQAGQDTGQARRFISGARGRPIGCSLGPV